MKQQGLVPLCRRTCFRAELKSLWRQHFDLLGKLADLNKLIWAHILKTLHRFGYGPGDFQAQDTRRLAESDMLGERRSAERPTAIYGPKDSARSLAVIFNRQLDLRANGAAIGFHANQLDIDPVIVISGICEEPKGVRIPGRGPSHGRQYVFMSSIAQVGERRTMPLVQIPDPDR